ncbi:helix-turn-helix transcriptional regulator [Sediminispirochaeta bajacaliforniensis]|uniref:helix-turn-helix transcriptional regulator n=1 Tax=Sediminispirochaeta bajacaliforniensis TaxID=148 RepID=UPI00039EED2D|nr:helix-turn-helix transcriptional regulator [Sediminispirochaeta bajacaliforniensis]
MSINRMYTAHSIDGQQDLFIYRNQQEYLRFLEQLFYEAIFQKDAKIIYYGPEKACNVMQSILSFWNFHEKKQHIVARMVPQEEFLDENYLFDRESFLSSLSESLQNHPSQMMYSCIDLNFPILTLGSETEIEDFILTLDAQSEELATVAFRTIFFEFCGNEIKRKRLIQHHRRVFFSNETDPFIAICKKWNEEIEKAKSGMIELLASEQFYAETYLIDLLEHSEKTLAEKEHIDNVATPSLFQECAWIIDEAGIIRFLSASIEDITGRKASCYVGKNILHVTLEINKKPMEELFRHIQAKFKQTNAEFVQASGRFFVKGGERRLLDFAVVPIRLATRNLGYLGVVRVDNDANFDEQSTFEEMAKLNDRQKEILDYLVEGFPTRAISSKLNLAEITIKKHLSGIYKKFGVSNRNELMAELLTRTKGYDPEHERRAEL